MQTLATQSITAGQSVPVSAGSRSTVGAVVLFNESNTLIRVAWGGSAQWLPAWTGEVFYMNQDPGFTGTFTLVASTISSSGSAPSNIVAGQIYAPGEHVPGTYPVALVRQTNIGNGSLPVSQVQTVINDGSAAGTSVVEATQFGQATSSLSLKNDGTALLAPVSNGALLDVLQVTPGGAAAAATGSFGDAANPGNWALHGVADEVPASGVQAGTLGAGVAVPAANVQAGTLGSGVALTKISSDGGTINSDGFGNLTVDNTLVLSSASDDSLTIRYTGAHTTWPALEMDMTSVTGGHAWDVRVVANASELFFFDQTAGGQVAAIFRGGAVRPGVQFAGLGGFVTGMQEFAGTGSGTYSHGAGATPTVVLANGTYYTSGTASQTVGSGIYGSSTCSVTCGNGSAFRALAVVVG